MNKIRDGEFEIPVLKSLPADGGPEFNRLIFESSPYLLQHARNPVDWYPWCDEAFQKAKNENKPIFLSIGYSTCHWCHVMEHESFEEMAVASYLNQHFVSIKVDREERPDIDQIYMTVCQSMTGSGGWPLTIFMTHDQKPFFAGTYFPKESRYGRPGFIDLIKNIYQAWNEKGDKIFSTGNKIHQQLQDLSDNSSSDNSSKEVLTKAILDKAVLSFKNSYDPRYGGFGHAPKFPMGHSLSFLLRQYYRTKDKSILEMVEKILTSMYQGGIYDHIGFGFARYSTDERWFAPHFEKMLYDNALLLITYCEAFQITRNLLFEKAAREICTYIIRDMRDEAGGFYSAENADTESEEGKFYAWTYNEIIDALVPADGEFAVQYYGVEKTGNWEHGKNILHTPTPIDVFARSRGMSVDDAQKRIELIRGRLYETRFKRIHPSLDDKVLTSWNGLAIAALSIAGRTFNNQEYIDAAIAAADFMLQNMKQTDGSLLHRYRKGEKGIEGFLEDYAFLVWGLIDVYQTTFDTKYLREAIELNKKMLDDFSADDGGLFFTSNKNEKLIARTKEVYDGATPSGNSVAAYNCIRLCRLTGDMLLEERANKIMYSSASQISQSPTGFTMMLTAFDFAFGPTKEIVITGNKNAEDTKEMLRTLFEMYIPNKVVVLHEDGEVGKEIESIVDFIKPNISIEGKATAYVCENFVCKIPTTSPEKLRESIIP